MNRKSGTSTDAADKQLQGITHKLRKQYPTEEKIRIVPAGLRGKERIAGLCRRKLRRSWLQVDRHLGECRKKTAGRACFSPCRTPPPWRGAIIG